MAKVRSFSFSFPFPNCCYLFLVAFFFLIVIINSTRVIVYCDNGVAICGKCSGKVELHCCYLHCEYLHCLLLNLDAAKEGDLFRNPFTSVLTKVITLKRGGSFLALFVEFFCLVVFSDG